MERSHIRIYVAADGDDSDPGTEERPLATLARGYAIVRQAETHSVQEELAGTHTRGETTVDWFDRTGQEPNVELVLELDTERLWELLHAAVR